MSPAETPPAAPTGATNEPCEQCGKPASVCVCDRLPKLAKPRLEVLMLQHPQEPDKLIGTARLTELAVPSAHLVVGLSWASLSHAVGREVDAKKWGILYLGSLKKELTEGQKKKPLVVLDRAGDERDVKREPLEGIVVLDGTWSQAKTLWWRNPWMLKLNRVLLHPKEPSLYGQMRKEPRRECLSTIESVAEALDAMGEKPETRAELKKLFRTMLQRARDAQKADEATRPPRRPAPDRRAGSRRTSKSKPKSRGGGPLD